MTANQLQNPNLPDMSSMNQMQGQMTRVAMPGPRPSGIPGNITTMPLQQPGPRQQPVQQANPPPPSESPDPMIRAKALLSQLKESLVNLMSVASQNFAVNVNVDDVKKVTDV